VVRDIISLPLRIGFKATSSAARLGWSGAQQLAGLLGSRNETEWPAPAAHDADPGRLIVDARKQSPAPAPARTEARPPEPAVRSAPEAVLTPEPPAPAHVETETELVAEIADPGAVDGAGAEVEVAAPWDGYDRLTAADVADRVAAASPAELGVVALYERANRGRQTVLRAVERRLAETT
jgi:hypothetical protein